MGSPRSRTIRLGGAVLALWFAVGDGSVARAESVGADTIRAAGDGALEAAIEARIAFTRVQAPLGMPLSPARRSRTGAGALLASPYDAADGGTRIDALGDVAGFAEATEFRELSAPRDVADRTPFLSVPELALPAPGAWRWPHRSVDAPVPALFHADTDGLALRVGLTDAAARVRAPLGLVEYASALSFARVGAGLGAPTADADAEGTAALAFSGDGRFGPFSVSHAVTRTFSARGPRTPGEEDGRATVAAVRVALPTDFFRAVGSGFAVRGDGGGRADGADDPYGPGRAGASGGGDLFGSALPLGDPRAAVSSFLFRDAEGAFGAEGATVAASGVRVLHAGIEWDLGPRTTAFAHVARVRFDDAERARGRGPADEAIGLDVSLGLAWRPRAVPGVVVHTGVAVLAPRGSLRRTAGESPILAVFLSASLPF